MILMLLLVWVGLHIVFRSCSFNKIGVEIRTSESTTNSKGILLESISNSTIKALLYNKLPEQPQV